MMSAPSFVLFFNGTDGFPCSSSSKKQSALTFHAQGFCP
jgi:hypothetical protein